MKSPEEKLTAKEAAEVRRLVLAAMVGNFAAWVLLVWVLIECWEAVK